MSSTLNIARPPNSATCKVYRPGQWKTLCGPLLSFMTIGSVFRGKSSVFPERSKQFGLGSTTAAEMVRLCEALQRDELVSPEACAAMRKHLRACDDKDKFSRFLPAGTKVAFKTGSLDATRTVAGLIECAQGAVAVCVLTDGNADKSWRPENAGNKLCAEIARAVFDHFGPRPASGPEQAAGDNAKPD